MAKSDPDKIVMPQELYKQAGELRMLEDSKRAEARKLKSVAAAGGNAGEGAEKRAVELVGEADTLGANAAEIEKRAEDLQETNRQAFSSAARGTGHLTIDGEPAFNHRARVLRPGEVRTLSKGESMADLYPDTGVSLTGMVRGLALGDWSQVPTEYRALLSSGAAAAVPGYISGGIIDMARQQSVVFQAGAAAMGMDAPTAKVALMTSDPSVVIDPEADDRELDEGAFTFEPREVAVASHWLYVKLSMEALEDVIGLESAIQTSFARQMALAFDHEGLNGSGQNGEGLGIANMTHAVDRIGELMCTEPMQQGRNGYIPFIEAMGKVKTAFHVPTAIVYPTAVWTALNSLEDTLGQPLAPPRAYNVPEFVSDLLPSDGGTGHNESTAVIGDFRKLTFATRTNLQIEVNRLGEGFHQGMIEIRAYSRFSHFVTDPTAFCKLGGISSEGEDPYIS